MERRHTASVAAALSAVLGPTGALERLLTLGLAQHHPTSRFPPSPTSRPTVTSGKGGRSPGAAVLSYPFVDREPGGMAECLNGVKRPVVNGAGAGAGLGVEEEEEEEDMVGVSIPRLRPARGQSRAERAHEAALYEETARVAAQQAAARLAREQALATHPPSSVYARRPQGATSLSGAARGALLAKRQSTTTSRTAAAAAARGGGGDTAFPAPQQHPIVRFKPLAFEVPLEGGGGGGGGGSSLSPRANAQFFQARLPSGPPPERELLPSCPTMPTARCPAAGAPREDKENGGSGATPLEGSGEPDAQQQPQPQESQDGGGEAGLGGGQQP